MSRIKKRSYFALLKDDGDYLSRAEAFVRLSHTYEADQINKEASQLNTFRYFSFLLLIILFGCSPKQLVQTGSVAMPHMARPTSEQWQMVYKERVTFHQPFRSPPQIQVSLSSIEAYHHSQGTFYQLKIINPDASGFELQIYGAYMDSFSNCMVNWIAVGEQ